MADSAQGDQDSKDASAGSKQLLQDAHSLWQQVAGLAYERLTLAALETRRAGESLVFMLSAGVIVAVLLVSAWLGLVVAAVLALVGSGVIAAFAILIGVAANLVMAVVLYALIRRKRRHLQWESSIRSLAPPSVTPRGVENGDAAR